MFKVSNDLMYSFNVFLQVICPSDTAYPLPEHTSSHDIRYCVYLNYLKTCNILGLQPNIRPET